MTGALELLEERLKHLTTPTTSSEAGALKMEHACLSTVRWADVHQIPTCLVVHCKLMPCLYLVLDMLGFKD